MKKLYLAILLFVSIFTLSSCGYVENLPTGGIIKSEEKSETPTKSEENKGTVEFTVTLTWKGYPFDITDEEIYAIWSSRTTEVRSKVGTNAKASTYELDGEYYVHLSNTPEGYTYDPNGLIATSDSPNVNIELMLITTTGKKKGSNLYTDIITINNITIKDRDNVGESYAYQATINGTDSGVYYQFEPKNAGVYTIESLVDTNNDLINPKIEKFNGTVANKISAGYIDDGGYSKKGGYTKNFLWEVSIDKVEIGGIFAFKVMADTKDSTYPVVVTFRITYISFYEMERNQADYIFANEVYYKRDSSGNIIYEDKNGVKTPVLNYVLLTDANKYYKTSYGDAEAHGIPQLNANLLQHNVNSSDSRYERIRYSKSQDGSYYEDPNGSYVLMGTINTPSVSGTWQNFGTFKDKDIGFAKKLTIKGEEKEYVVLDGSRMYYNDKDGYYHFDSVTGPIVCAKITSPSAFIELPLNHVEDPGNAQLRLFGKQNYKRFVESEYADMCNSDGVCYVTKELKEFLQKLSNSGCYFFDGNGWCEQDNVFASEEDQWLFACGFYKS